MKNTKQIILSNDYTIYQDEKTPHIYTIVFFPFTNSEALINSITKTKIITGATITNNYQTLQIKATSIQTLSQYKKSQKKEHCNQMLIYLTQQLEYLIKKTNHTFIGYHPNNVIIIDENKFIYLSDEHLHKIEQNNITITYPFSKTDFFLSPELENIKEIPSKAHYKTSYYSLACLIIDIFKKKEEQEQPQEQTIIEEQEMTCLKGSKIYYLLKRCLDPVPNKRSILFI
jgi:hypothetical protein